MARSVEQSNIRDKVEGMQNSASSLLNTKLPSRPPRFCDVCITEQAKLYCAADDAYLCSSCDVDVHNANSLAQRHERVRLGPNGAPLKIDRKGGGDSLRIKKEESTTTTAVSANSGSLGGIRKKSRNKNFNHGVVTSSLCKNNMDLGAGDPSLSTETENGAFLKMACKAFDTESEHAKDGESDLPKIDQFSTDQLQNLDECEAFTETYLWNHCDNLFGDGRDMDSFQGFEDLKQVPGDPDMTGLHAVFSDNQLVKDKFRPVVKIENTEFDFDQSVRQSTVTSVEQSLEGMRDMKPSTLENDHSHKVEIDAELNGAAGYLQLFEGVECFDDKMLTGYPSLSLDHEAIIQEWSDRGGVWMDEEAKFYNFAIFEAKADIIPVNHPSDKLAGSHEDASTPRNADVAENRKARVMRYREKRRNRLFSKKVRYEVRKLNAERRPRIKVSFTVAT